MNTVLVIASARSTRDAWCLALRRRGLACKKADGLVMALDDMVDGSLAGIIFESRSDADLGELVALSTLHALPPVVIVSGPTSQPVASRFTAGSIVDPDTPTATIAARLSCLVRHQQFVSPTHLPVRLTPILHAQWTVRLTCRPATPVDDFDGATHPDGFDIAKAC